jgi:hypothetical protein
MEVFLSYRVPESGAVELKGDGTVKRLANDLRALGISVFVGEAALQAGEAWADEIQGASVECKCLCVSIFFSVCVLLLVTYGDTKWTKL